MNCLPQKEPELLPNFRRGEFKMHILTASRVGSYINFSETYTINSVVRNRISLGPLSFRFSDGNAENSSTPIYFIVIVTYLTRP